MKTTLHNIYAVLFNCIIGALVALFVFGASPIVGAIFANVFMLALAFVKQFYTGTPIFFKGLAFAGLLKEIWIGKLMENFYPNGSWLLESEDMSAFVENNTINLADAGVDPVVLVNNTSYPIAITERTDVPLALPLDYYDSGNTVVRSATAIQLAYDKLSSVVRQHRQAIYKKNLQKAAWNYGPASNTAVTPVVAIGTSFIDTVIDAQATYDALDVPTDGRILLLCPLHKSMLKKEDKLLFKDVFGQNGSGMLYGFKVYDTTVTPIYNGTTLVKAAFGAVAAGTDAKSSLFYSKYEVMRCEGTYDMFSRMKDPEARGDIIGFQKRFLATSIRNKYNGAIVGNALAEA